MTNLAIMKKTLRNSAVLARLARFAQRLARSHDANITLIASLTLLPTLFGLGFCIDYARAEMLQSRIAAVADAAALAATDPVYFTKRNATATAAATTIFKQQVTDYADFSYAPATQLIVKIDDSGSYSQGRIATVSWGGQSANMFSTILGSASLAISGVSQSTASLPPYINFYIALDTSPSMLLPTSSTGITNLTNGAIWKGESTYYPGNTDGCDFACHSNNMHMWNSGVFVIDANGYAIFQSGSTFYRASCPTTSGKTTTPGNVYDASGNLLGNTPSFTGVNTSNKTVSATTYCTSGTLVANPITMSYYPTKSSTLTSVSVTFPDTWWLAQNYSLVNPGQANINLRTDDESSAAAGVIQYAYNYQVQLASTYASTSSPTYNMQFYTFDVNGAVTLTAPFGTMTAVSTLQSQQFPNLGAAAPLMYANSYWTTQAQVTNNADSNFSTMMANMKLNLPLVQGAGTKASPQNVLIIITDGLEDDATDGTTALNATNIAQCTYIKNTNFTRIAILYTQYDPNTINYTGDTNFNTIATNTVPSIAAKLAACATTNPDGSVLMQTVTTGGSLATALNELFAQAVKTAHLTQ